MRADDFAVARLARLLSVTVAALALTAVLDTVGRMADPSWYANDPLPNFPALAATLLFANELWGNDLTFGTNSPYWSLGYEVPFYALYGLAVFMRGRARWVALALAAAVAGPRILVMFPLWLMGAFACSAAEAADQQAGRLVPVAGLGGGHRGVHRPAGGRTSLFIVVQRRGGRSFLEDLLIQVIHAEIQRVVDHTEHKSAAEHPGLAEHAPHRQAASGASCSRRNRAIS